MIAQLIILAVATEILPVKCSTPAEEMERFQSLTIVEICNQHRREISICVEAAQAFQDYINSAEKIITRQRRQIKRLKRGR